MNMKKSSPLGARAEVMLMGFTVPVDNNEEARDILEYIHNTIKLPDAPEVILKNAFKYSNPDTVVRYIGCNTVQGFNMITLVLDTKDEEEPFEEDLESRDGIFCYAYNVDAPDCSELGYSFFRKIDGLGYKRIG